MRTSTSLSLISRSGGEKLDSWGTLNPKLDCVDPDVGFGHVIFRGLSEEVSECESTCACPEICRLKCEKLS
jgi:hypothetical protein